MAQSRRFLSFEKRVHVYSGLDPEAWKQFLLNIKTFEFYLGTTRIDESAQALYRALENIRVLGTGSEWHDETDALADELGYEGEFILNQNAISRGLYFFPKYLNETLKDYSEDVRTDPFPRRRGDQ